MGSPSKLPAWVRQGQTGPTRSKRSLAGSRWVCWREGVTTAGRRIGGRQEGIVSLKLLCCAFVMVGAALAQQPGATARTFGNRCTICHGGDGNGTDRAPSLLGFVGS